MANKLVNRAKMTVSGTPGTGTITLGSAVTSFMDFATAGIVDGDVVSYLIEDGTAWELGKGTYTASGATLARTTCLFSSAGGTTKISATSAATVSVVPLASDLQADYQVFTASGTWTKPGWCTGNERVFVLGWGAGGGGGSGTVTATGGGGGACVFADFLASDLGSTETVTVPAGGATGASNAVANAGGNATFGSHLTAYGGGPGQGSASYGGGGGGWLGAGAAGSTGAGAPGKPGIPSSDGGTTFIDNQFGGGFAGLLGGTIASLKTVWGGGGGAGTSSTTVSLAGTATINGGGGGGSRATSSIGAVGATSTGGPGGAGSTTTASAGSAPGGGGGGGATGGAGGRGEIRVWVFR